MLGEGGAKNVGLTHAYLRTRDQLTLYVVYISRANYTDNMNNHLKSRVFIEFTPRSEDHHILALQGAYLKEVFFFRV